MIIRVNDRRVFSIGQDHGLLLFWHTDYTWHYRIVLSHEKLSKEEKVERLDGSGITYEIVST